MEWSLADLGTARSPLDGRDPPLTPLGELKNYYPSPSERVGNWMQDGLMALGMKSYNAGHIAHNGRDLLSLTPAGVPMSLADLGHYAEQGDLEGMAWAALGATPAVKMGGLAAKEARSALASKNAFMYNTPVKSPRPFEADYKTGGQANDAGRLLTDIEGRPLIAENVVGRRVLGGADEALTPAQLDAIATAAFGSTPQSVPARTLPRGSVGAFSHVRGADGPERSIRVLDTLDPISKDRVTAHEFGHGIDDIAGLIPTDGIKKELGTLYHDLNDPSWRRGQPTRPGLQTNPESHGYAGRDVSREYIAEAVRAYMADPNYIKTVAPNVAARIREYVNNNPHNRKSSDCWSIDNWP